MEEMVRYILFHELLVARDNPDKGGQKTNHNNMSPE